MAEWSPTPATKRFSDMKREIARYVLRDSSPDALDAAGEAANNGIRALIAEREWEFNLTYHDFSWEVDKSDRNIPTNLDKPRALELLNSSNQPNGRLTYKPMKQFLIDHPVSTSGGTPLVYTILARQDSGLLSVNVAPTQAWINTYPKGRLWYYMRTALYTSDDQRLDGPIEAELFVLWYGRFDLANSYVPQKATLAEKQANKTLRALRRKDNRNRDWHIYPIAT